MERVVGEELVGLAYEDRLEVLARHAVGLWDTVGSAHRRGSLDGAMREIAPNPLRDLVQRLPRLRAIGFNGGTAARIGRRQLAESDMAMIDLPSSSPALTLAFEKKAERWTQLRPFLQSDD